MNKEELEMVLDIREFQEKIGGVKEGSKGITMDPDFMMRVPLRNKLLREEVEELEEALYKEDKVEVLDAIVDIIYIALGTAHESGVLDLFQKAWKLVHKNNMSKVGPDGKVMRRLDGKIIKPKGFQPVNLKELFTADTKI